MSSVDLSNLSLDEKKKLYKEAADLAVKKARKNFLAFVRLMDASFSIAPHHKLIADRLEWLEAGHVRRQIISQPPRSGKSQMTSVYYVAWCIGKNPKWEIMAVSYKADLAAGFGRQVRNLMNSDIYKLVFPAVSLSEDSRAAGKWNTDQGGAYIAAGVGSAIVGKGANLAIIDDPISEQDADNPAALQAVVDWYSPGLTSRLMPNARIIVVMTRWSTMDLAGWLLEKQRTDPFADKWEDLRIPAILEPGYEKAAKLLGLPIGSSYWPEEASDFSPDSKIPFWSMSELIARKANMPPRKWECLYQQNPAPDSGQIFKADSFKRWDGKLPKCTYIFQSYDTAFGIREANDYTAITTWGVFRHEGINNIILLGLVKERLEFPDLCKKALELVSIWDPNLLLVEKKASGQSLIQTLRRYDLTIQEYTPDKDKRARAHAATPFIDSGKVWIPFEPWGDVFIEEMALFGTPGAHDDVVDSATQAIQFVVNNNLISTSSFMDEEDDEDRPQEKYMERYY